MSKYKVGDRVRFYWDGRLRAGKVEAVTHEILSVPNFGSDAWIYPYFWLNDSDIVETGKTGDRV